MKSKIEEQKIKQECEKFVDFIFSKDKNPEYEKWMKLADGLESNFLRLIGEDKK